MECEPVDILEKAGIRATSNRMLVLKALLKASSPLSLIELETLLETLERSSILRVLTLFYNHGIVHSMEDGRGVEKYEICSGSDACSPEDMHVHFYCEKCDSVYCFDHAPVPEVDVPKGFSVKGVNYMIKGICPKCKKD